MVVIGAVFALHDNPPKQAQAEINKQGTSEIVQATPPPPVSTPEVKPVEPVAEKKVAPQTQPKQETVKPQPVITGSKTDWLRQAGIPENEWGAVDYIVQKESSWNYLAVNRSSGATGLCQALPASKMATAGADYMTNPITQLKWCHSYAHSRYGGWWSAYNFWVTARWW